MYKALYSDAKNFENGEEYTMLNLSLILRYLSTSNDIIFPHTYGLGKCFDDLKICVEAERVWHIFTPWLHCGKTEARSHF